MIKLIGLISVYILFIIPLSLHAAIKSNMKQPAAAPPLKSMDKAWVMQAHAAKLSSYFESNDFQFDSTRGPLFHRYHGYTHTSALGRDNVKYATISSGLYLTNADTKILTFSKLGPLLTESTRVTHNNGLYFHATKNIIDHVQLDFFAGYGRNKFNLCSTSETEQLGLLTGYADYHGHDELAGIRGLFTYYFHALFLQSDIDYFYARFNQPDYEVFYPNHTITVPKLTTRVGTYIENTKLSYFLNDYVSPFITGTLIQVGSRSYSRPVISPSAATSPLPELAIAKMGYAYGAGLMFKYKKIIVTTSYRHENRKNIYFGNVYLLKFDWAIG